MKIIPRYVLLKHFLPIFALSITGFVAIYLIVDFFEHVDQMLANNVPLREIYIYFLWKIPTVATQGIPMAAMLSAIIAPWADEAKPGVDRNGDGGRKSHLLCRTYRNGGARAFGSPFLRGGVRGAPPQSEDGGNLAGKGGA